MSGSSSHEGIDELTAKITLDGKLGYSSRGFTVVEISNLNKVEESYIEESLQHKKPTDSMLMASSSRSPVGDGLVSPKYPDRLSSTINNYLSEA